MMEIYQDIQKDDLIFLIWLRSELENYDVIISKPIYKYISFLKLIKLWIKIIILTS